MRAVPSVRSLPGAAPSESLAATPSRRDPPFFRHLMIPDIATDLIAPRASGSDTQTSALPFPFRVGAIDIGSNAMRLLAAEFTEAHLFEVLDSQRVPVRLGHDVFLTGKLAPEVMDAAVAAMKGFRETLDGLGITRYRAVATSAVRESRNGDEFVERVREEAGLDLEVITGAEEARLVHVAVASRVPLHTGKWVLVDLGGGSVEVSLVDETGILWSESHTMGSVRLLEELSGAGDEPGRFQRLLREYASTLRIPAVALQWKIEGMVATGGNMETLALLAGAALDEQGVSHVPVGQLRAIIDTLARLSYRERVEQLGLREDRADVILPAATVYEHLATVLDVADVQVPHVGIKEGVLLDVVADVVTHRDHAERKSRQSITGALNLGRRYAFDEAHGVHVARLAVSLFDQLQKVHELGEADRRILAAAAILHDIGTYLSHKRHHKHSLYLISQADLPGFTPREILMVANVARYHRKSEPAPRHEDFMRLPAPERERVTRLAALLRIADALDREHLQRVRKIRARIKKKRLLLRFRGEGDLLVERWMLQRKAALFSQVFGLDVELSEKADSA